MFKSLIYLSIFILVAFVYEVYVTRNNSPRDAFRRNRGIRKCRDGFYMHKADCLPCNCDRNGAKHGFCNSYMGVCVCKVGYQGQKCSVCSAEYYKDLLKKSCMPCNCNKIGSQSARCDGAGHCYCKPKIGGKKCSYCINHYQNFCKKCNKKCPKRYNLVADEFKNFLGTLNALEKIVNEMVMAKIKINQLSLSVKYLKEEVSKSSPANTDLDKLKCTADGLQDEVRLYVIGAKNINDLLGIIKNALTELDKIMKINQASMDVCLETCEKMELVEKNRDYFLRKLNILKIDYVNVLDKRDSLETAAKALKNAAQSNKKWSTQIDEDVVSLIDVLEDILFGLENDKVIMDKLNELKNQMREMKITFEETQKLETDYELQNVKALNSMVAGSIPKINETTKNVLKDLKAYEEKLRRIISSQQTIDQELTTYQLSVEDNFDKLYKYKLLVEKHILDDKLTQEKLKEIYTVLSKLKSNEIDDKNKMLNIMNVFEEIENYLEKYTKLEEEIKEDIMLMERKNDYLEGELKDINEKMTEAEKDISNLEDVLKKLQEIKWLSEELRKIKNLIEEINTVADVCKPQIDLQ